MDPKLLVIRLGGKRPLHFILKKNWLNVNGKVTKIVNSLRLVTWMIMHLAQARIMFDNFLECPFQICTAIS